jgi:hypothetical protein
MTTYYENNRSSCIERAKNYYNKVKDNEDFLLRNKLYNKMYYDTVLKEKRKVKKYVKIEKLKNRVLEFPTLPQKIDDPFILTFD